MSARPNSVTVPTQLPSAKPLSLESLLSKLKGEAKQKQEFCLSCNVDHRVSFRNPCLPPAVSELRIHNLAICGGSLDLQE